MDCSEYVNPFEASYVDAEPTSHLKLIDLHCSDELRTKVKESE